MTQQYYSNGKLLITGEYTVLDGATAFALPTRMGQDLIVTSIPTPHITWKSFDADHSIWFEGIFTIEDVVQSRQFNDDTVKNTLIDILHAAHKMNPMVLSNSGGYAITTHLTFPRQWGLGTSSTVINNIASWFSIDPFTLLKNSFGGSGYDIACAMTNGPLCYRLNSGHPEIEKVIFDPPFKNDIYFIYLNKKQNTKTAVQAYRQNNGSSVTNTEAITALTAQLLQATSITAFAAVLEQHELLLSSLLGIPTIQSEHFADFNGTIKSLGAWGGDFIMAITTADPTAYFKAKGYPTLLSFEEMILL